MHAPTARQRSSGGEHRCGSYLPWVSRQEGRGDMCVCVCGGGVVALAASLHAPTPVEESVSLGKFSRERT